VVGRVALLELRLGRAETVAMVHGASEQLDPNLWKLPYATKWWAPAVEPAKAELGRAAYAEAVARGRELEISEVLELARDLKRQIRHEGQTEGAGATVDREESDA
jgi:hypothetical protein